jgi:hypothetical protein
MMFRLQRSGMPDDGQDTVFHTLPEAGRVTGDFGHLVKPSMYTRLFELRPLWQRLLGLTALAGAAIFVRRSRQEKPQMQPLKMNAMLMKRLNGLKPVRRAARLRAILR